MSQTRIFAEGSDRPIVYEITVRTEPSLADEFAAFMVERHVPDLLQTGHFKSATIAKSGGTLRIAYIAISSEHLRTYLDDHAPRLRSEVVRRFPTGLQIERNEWELLGVLMTESTAC